MAEEELQNKREVARLANVAYSSAHGQLVEASRAAAAADVLLKKLAAEAAAQLAEANRVAAAADILAKRLSAEAAEALHNVRLAELNVEKVTIGKLIGYEYI